MIFQTYNCMKCWKLCVEVNGTLLKPDAVLALVGELSSREIRENCVDCAIRCHLVQGRKAVLNPGEFVYVLEGFTDSRNAGWKKSGVGADGKPVSLIQREDWLVLEEDPDWGLWEEDWRTLTEKVLGSLVFLD